MLLFVLSGITHRGADSLTEDTSSPSARMRQAFHQIGTSCSFRWFTLKNFTRSSLATTANIASLSPASMTTAPVKSLARTSSSQIMNQPGLSGFELLLQMGASKYVFCS